LKKDESNDEDLIDAMFGLGWFDDIYHMHSCETGSVDENGKMPISLKKDESKDEDLIDAMFGLGWFDDI